MKEGSRDILKEYFVDGMVYGALCGLVAGLVLHACWPSVQAFNYFPWIGIAIGLLWRLIRIRHIRQWMRSRREAPVIRKLRRLARRHQTA